MRKNMVVFCLFITMLFVCLPVVSSESMTLQYQTLATSGEETQRSTLYENQNPLELTGYLLIHVSVYTPGEGLHPYMGANISVKGLIYKYTGQTDERGDCLFQLHSRLFRPKLYFIKVSIPPADWLHTKINSMYIQTGQIAYRDYLFVVL